MTIKKPVDLTIVDLKKDIINLLNTSALPLVVLNMIIKDISGTLDKEVDPYMKELRTKYEQQVASEEQVEIPTEGVDINGD